MYWPPTDANHLARFLERVVELRARFAKLGHSFGECEYNTGWAGSTTCAHCGSNLIVWLVGNEGFNYLMYGNATVNESDSCLEHQAAKVFRVLERP